MIHAGDKLENPVTGEVLVFHRTSEETDGESVLVETIVRAHGFVAAAHVHPHQTERFEVLEGLLGLRVGDKELVARPGDIAVVAPGTPHRFWNAGEDEARFLCEIRPALRFESLIETMFTLAAEGKTNRKGMPNPAAARGDRERALRHRPPPLPTRSPAARGARGRSAARQGARLPVDDRPASAERLKPLATTSRSASSSPPTWVSLTY
jgi:quercetin dioxygenase-like cupin family protein